MGRVFPQQINLIRETPIDTSTDQPDLHTPLLRLSHNVILDREKLIIRTNYHKHKKKVWRELCCAQLEQGHLHVL